ncbi:MAG TPA: hypothetical protein VMH06_06800 [Thermodesulfovibrionales bacterium]|nr:hypothetical protein [Thermodesulfovibrionales bacterium]
MKQIFLGVVMVMAVFLSSSSMAFAGAISSGHRAEILSQSTDQETSSDQGTPQEEPGSGQQDTVQDAGAIQGFCTADQDCPEQKEAPAPDK